MTEHKPQMVQVRVGELTIDPSIQRSLDIKRVERMAREYDRGALGAITISVRPDGAKHVIDGQHRASLVKTVEGDSALVNAVAYTGLSRAEEAEYFRKLNSTKQVHPLVRFKVRLVEADPTAVTINRILAEAGWEVAPGGEDGKVAAIGELERIYYGAGIKRGTEHPQAVRKTIQTLTKAWGHKSDAVRRELIGGVGMVFVKYPDADADKIARELSQQGSPMQVIAMARARVVNKHQVLSSVMAGVIVELHNKKRRTHRLPVWDAA